MKATVAGVPILVAGLAMTFAWHIAVGAKSVPLTTVFDALTAFDASQFDHVIIRELRMPRAIIAACVGTSLSVAGALMQGVTRNPLAEPGVLGLLVGASFAVVVGIGVFDIAGAGWIPLFAAIGATGAAALVWGIALAAPGGATPLTLVLAGAAISAFLAAFVTLANILDQQTFETLRVWLSGSLSRRATDVMYWSVPWMVIGLGIAFAIARRVTALSMGDDTATGLGVDVVRLRTLALVSVVALTAASVAVAGPMGFVGLVIPHVVRLFVGADYRRIIPISALTGAIYLLAIDIAARLLLGPTEIATGIVTAMLGAPFFIWLVRSRL
jgi:iron complex transport system permease protein